MAKTTNPIPMRPSQRSLWPAREGERICSAEEGGLAATESGLGAWLGAWPGLWLGLWPVSWLPSPAPDSTPTGREGALASGPRCSVRPLCMSASTRRSSRATRSSRTGFSGSGMPMFPPLSHSKE